MNRAWVVVAAMAAMAAPGRAEDAVVTVFTYDRANVPWFAMARAEQVASKAFAEAGIEVRWVKGRQLGESRHAASGEILTVVFDSHAPAQSNPDATATTQFGKKADANTHVFFDRVARFKDPVHMPEFLGNVLAHELTHALEGVARHAGKGLMKAAWDVQDYGKMVHGPLPFAAVDLELLRAHFQEKTSPALTVAAR